MIDDSNTLIRIRDAMEPMVDYLSEYYKESESLSIQYPNCKITFDFT